MNEIEHELPELDSVARMQTVQNNLRRLERRDWWLWCAAVVVMLVLTMGIISLSIPGVVKDSDRYFQFNLNLAVRGLVALVLLFNIYTLYQQVLIKRLRKEMSEHVAQMSGLKSRAEEFHKLSTLDPLTGLHNRRLAEKRLAGEVSRSQRHGRPLSVLMFDLDGFKEVNDRFGHAAGDLILRTFADKLNTVIRVSDLAVRLGGDEFMVLLPECQPQQVQSLLDRLGSIQLDFQGHAIPVKYSAGCAGYQAGETAQKLVERADLALYENKRARKSLQAVPVGR